ncbi:unnamed protein product [Mycena citricolor]|uniref:HTH CENPB-type domain-containing protein n=1 Tax=Mycena citricolor TaxID=2018698 RepID=A0AAD2H458_9AGAR|nr:unnamed protein product [Mycena citricolor]
MWPLPTWENQIFHILSPGIWNQDLRDKNPTKDRAKQGPKEKKSQTSAQLVKDDMHKDLTWSDWVQVFDYMNKSPGAFKEAQKKDQIRVSVANSSTVGSQKRARVVTCPEVDKALSVWMYNKEEKRNMVTGTILVVKRKCLEELMGIPEEQCLTGNSWLESFKKVNDLHECKRYGKAGSVDLKAVEEERKCMCRIMVEYAPKDRWNTDETSFFPSAPPNCSLCSAPMPSQKQDKFCLSVLVAYNATGTEKEQLMFIGKSARPCCFKRKDPARMRPPLYYQANQKAWMTGLLFDKWLGKLDQKMHCQHLHIVLLLNNVSGHHNISYKPRNIHLTYFKPNLTLFVQPCDVGIIRCIKAHYRKKQAVWALDHYEDGVEAPFKINIQSAMRMLTKAWDEVSQSTIANCWKNSQICPKDTDEWEEIFLDADITDGVDSKTQEPIYKDCDVQMTMPNSKDIPVLHNATDQKGWAVILEFATMQMSLPTAKRCLLSLYGPTYCDEDWRPALLAVMNAERDCMAAEEAVQGLMQTCCLCGLCVPISNILLLVIEQEDADTVFLRVDNGDNGLCQIVAHVRQPEIIDLDNNNNDAGDGFEEFKFKCQDAMAAIDLLQKVAQNQPDLNILMALDTHLRKLKGALNLEAKESKTQTALKDLSPRNHCSH